MVGHDAPQVVTVVTACMVKFVPKSCFEPSSKCAPPPNVKPFAVQACAVSFVTMTRCASLPVMEISAQFVVALSCILSVPVLQMPSKWTSKDAREA